MDLAETLPPELCLRVLELLGPEDLTRCLAVSSRWRALADSPPLWRRFCRRRRLPNCHSKRFGPLPLCSWASTYIEHMSRLVGNWSTGTFRSYLLAKEDWCCCLACSGSLLAVYYPRASEVRIYSVDDKLEPLTEFVVALGEGPVIPDVFITEDCLVLCRGNTVLVYGPGFGLRAQVAATERGLTVLCPEEALPQPTDRRLYVKVLAGDVIWLESDNVFVLDLNSHNYRALEDTFRCLRHDSRRVMAANSSVSAYRLSGELEFRLEVAGVTDMWLEDDLAVLLVSDRLELWKLSSRCLIHTLTCSEEPRVCLGPEGSLYLLELGEGGLVLKRHALDSPHPLWAIFKDFPRQPTVHPELRLICERFLFVRPSHTSDLDFFLVDCRSGTILYHSPMPPSLSPPSYIYHLSDEVFITAESGRIHIRRYV